MRGWGRRWPLLYKIWVPPAPRLWVGRPRTLPDYAPENAVETWADPWEPRGRRPKLWWPWRHDRRRRYKHWIIYRRLCIHVGGFRRDGLFFAGRSEKVLRRLREGPEGLEWAPAPRGRDAVGEEVEEKNLGAVKTDEWGLYRPAWWWSEGEESGSEGASDSSLEEGVGWVRGSGGASDSSAEELAGPGRGLPGGERISGRLVHARKGRSCFNRLSGV
jgi:hypothetical protein